MKRLLTGRRSRRSNVVSDDSRRWQSNPGEPNPAGPGAKLYTARLPSQQRRIYWSLGIGVFGLGVLAILAISLFMALAKITHMDAATAYRNDFLLERFTIEEAKSALSDMEAGNRGFVLTGDRGVRKTFYRGLDTFSSRYKELLAATSNEPVQQERLKIIKDKLTQWFKLYRPLIRKRDQIVEDDATDYKDRAILLECNALFDDMHFLLEEIGASAAADFYAGR